MARKQTAWKTKGMNRDLSVSAFNPEFSFENRNLRLITNENNTMLSWVNEKGTAEIYVYVDSTRISNLPGITIGTAVIDHKLILFLTNCPVAGGKDRIYKLAYTGALTMSAELLYGGNLGFNAVYPIETLTSYESTNVQKVYWTDNLNQPRMINVTAEDTSKYNNTSFDFVNELSLNESIWVTKELGAGGVFAPGVIQYAFTYYRKNGQETHIFYTTPLYYISYSDRGAAPDSKVENAFRITISSPDSSKFDYIRIYSIQRTSLNAVPVVKRIQDISLDGSPRMVSYLDVGTTGDIVAPTDLLYKGGEVIRAKTIEQKDGTLFLGNIYLNREQYDITDLESAIKADAEFAQDNRSFSANKVSTTDYIYENQLTSYYSASGVPKRSVPCGGFKRKDYYRCGVQFQHKSGRWSDPIYLNDVPVTGKPSYNPGTGTITVPTLSATFNDLSHVLEPLRNMGFKKARAVVVFPEMQDRIVVCQGVASQTLYTKKHRYDTIPDSVETGDNDLHAQSSWFFRSNVGYEGDYYSNGAGAVSPKSASDSFLRYTHRGVASNVPEGCHSYDPSYIRQVEIQGDYEDVNKYIIDNKMLTLHSPDIEFDDTLSVVEFDNLKCYQAGNVAITTTMSDIEILTETPTVSNSGGGFVHKSFLTNNSAGIISGLFYDDYLVDDYNDEDVGVLRKQCSPLKWMVYLWNKTGSLNNDINRPANMGTASAILKKKTISNLRYASTTLYDYNDSKYVTERTLSAVPKLFSSDETNILKVGGYIYQGNIDTVVIPDHTDGQYFAYSSSSVETDDVETKFDSTDWWKTFSKADNDTRNAGIWKKQTDSWENTGASEAVGDKFIDLALKKDPVRIKYKSTPHVVFSLSNNSNLIWNEYINSLPIVEMAREDTLNFRTNVMYGGTSTDALKENVWIPCGEPVKIPGELDFTQSFTIKYEYGDTYYQRWDCLKTYPFTLEDINQVIEIGSFMLETRVNIDGRYDRNRGQKSNIYTSPRNFNLLNPVYSQKDNFFSYRIQDADYYKSTTYPNQITWSLTKQSGADVDVWTDITLASVLELDGNKGEINKLTRYNDQLIAFQDSGIAQILYNENVQIAASNDVPIEIANSGKVQGSRYFSDTIGCSDKWSVVSTPLGVYFMDSNNKGIYMFNGQLANVTLTKGFSSWARQRIPSSKNLWNPVPWTNENRTGFKNFVSYYDKVNQDVLFIDKDEALAFSEKMGVFTSFYDYGNIPYFNNLDDTGVWVKNFIDNTCKLYKHNAGNYCDFFGVNKPYSMTLIGNPEPQLDKIFTNLEFRATVDGEGTISSNTFTPSLPFDFLETWDEYQHGIAQLNIRDGHNASLHHLNNTTGDGASLNRKFRIWRCDIPRDNTPKTSDQSVGNFYTLDTELGITRFSRRPMDRMRNPWVYLKLKKNAAAQNNALPRAELHDMMMTYFG